MTTATHAVISTSQYPETCSRVFSEFIALLPASVRILPRRRQPCNEWQASRQASRGVHHKKKRGAFAPRLVVQDSRTAYFSPRLPSNGSNLGSLPRTPDRKSVV